jgi:hypothetical protein
LATLIAPLIGYKNLTSGCGVYMRKGCIGVAAKLRFDPLSGNRTVWMTSAYLSDIVARKFSK